MNKKNIVPLKIDDTINLKIIRIGTEGDGIGFINKFAVIVKGETKLDKSYNVKITRILKQYAFAELI